MKKLALAILVFSISAPPSWAGKLDLDLYANLPVPAARGELRNLRGQSPFVRSVSHAGFASMGVLGLAQSKDSTAMAAGFGVIAIWQLWQLITNGPGAWKPKELEILGVPVTGP